MPIAGIIGQCFFYFMSGSTAYMFFGLACTLRLKNYLTIAVASCAVAIFYLKTNHLYFDGIPLVSSNFAKFDSLMMHLGMSSAFCFCVLLAATIDASQLCVKAEKIFLFVGSLTYSTYLWHLPIQIAVIIGFDIFSLDRSFFNYPLALVLFLFFMVAVGRLSFIYIERPIQIKIRNYFL
ncbi:hypothetical protein HYN24_07015 [Dechloromonas sp. HYN0024]|nr:hypothetical protein HYN24_07015 [Dechloromonas sp. HYN0024]